MNPYSLLRMRDLTTEEINRILDDAQAFSFSQTDWQLPKRTLIANLFFENSTRTHHSFASAELQLGALISDFSAEVSSVKKGESLYDTVKTFESIGYNTVVIRHPQDEYFKELENIQIPIINAGDGCGNHPTQCLLDLLTMRQEFNTLEKLNVLIVGDIDHSRVAHSNRDALEQLGSIVRYSGPKQWVSEQEVYMEVDEGIKWADVVMMLRIQKERGANLQKSDEEYLHQYGLTKERYRMMQKHAIIMHPAPVNRGVEIDDSLVECEKSRIFKQMENGVYVRKAVIKRAFNLSFDTGGKK